MNKKYSWQLIYFIALAGLLGLISLRSLKTDFNIDKLFASGDPDVAFYNEFKSKFQAEANEENIFIGLGNNEGIFREDFLKKIDSLTQYLSRLKHVLKVYSVTNSNIIFFRDSQVNARPLIHITQPYLYAEDSVYLFQSKEYRDLLVSRDGKTIAVAAFHEPSLNRKEKNTLLENISKKLAELKFDRTNLAGKIRAEHILIAESIAGTKNYLLFIILLTSLLFFLFFRRLSLIPGLLIVILPSLSTLTLFLVLGNPVHIIDSLLPAVLSIAGMPAFIMFSTMYRNKLAAESNALQNTIKECRVAICLASSISASAFFSLLIYDYMPVRNFGLFAGVGLLISGGLSIVILPAWYSRAKTDAVNNKIDVTRYRFPGAPLQRILQFKNSVLVLFCTLFLTSIFFSREMVTNFNIASQIPKHGELSEDYKFMESQFGGSRPFEMALSIRNRKHSFFDPEMMKKLETLESFLKDSFHVAHLISPLSLFKAANKAFNKGENDSFVLPASIQYVNRFYEAIMQTEHADEMQQYLLADGSQVRINGLMPNVSSTEFKNLVDRFHRFFNTTGYRSSFTYKMTGPAVLIDKLGQNMKTKLFIGGIIAFLLLFISSFYLLRSWQISFISILLVALPLFTIASIMEFMDIYLNMDTLIIFTINFAISATHMLYFLTMLKKESNTGLNMRDSLKKRFPLMSTTIIISSAILMAMFLSLMVYNFENIFHIGLITGIGLLISLFSTLVVLPAAISNYKRSAQEQSESKEQHVSADARPT